MKLDSYSIIQSPRRQQEAQKNLLQLNQDNFDK